MLISDIHKIFDTLMDKNAVAAQYGGCPAFLPEEKDIFLNQAVLERVSQKVGGERNITFEGSNKRTSDLQGLIKTDKGLTVTEQNLNVCTIKDFSNLSPDINSMYKTARLFPLNAQIQIGDNTYNCQLTSHNVAANYKQTAVNTPWVEEPLYYLEDNNLYIVVDPFSDKSTTYIVDLTYVKYPMKIDSTDFTKDFTDVPETVIYEIINRAVVIALENIESTRVNTKAQLNQLSE